MHRTARLSSAVLAAAIVGGFTPALLPAADSLPAHAAEAEADAAETGTATVRLFRDKNTDNQYTDGEDAHDGYINLEDAEGNWYKVVPESLEKQGLPAGTYTMYVRNGGIADGFGAAVDSATGERLPFVELDQKHDATYIDADDGSKKDTVTDTGTFVKTTLTITAGLNTVVDIASSRIDAEAKVSKDGEAVQAGVYFKDGEKRLESFELPDESSYMASDDADKKIRHFFTDDWVAVGVEDIDGYRVKGVTVTGMGAGKTAEAEKVSDTEYRIKRSEIGDDFGRFTFNVELEDAPAEPTGKVDFCLFRDKNLNNAYDGESEEAHDGYVTLVDEDGNWYKVLPEALSQHGLPVGNYTVYMRDAGVADGFGAIVDADGKRLPYTTLDEKHDATYIDADTGKKDTIVTDTGTFVTTSIAVKADETVKAHYAATRIDASAEVEGDGVDSVYFKDGEQKLGAFKADPEDSTYLAADESEENKRHFFSEDTVTLGVNVKDGHKITKVEVVPSATSGGDGVVLFDAADSSDEAGNEFTIDRVSMRDDFGRFEFKVTTEPADASTEEPTEEPTGEPTENPTDGATEQPTDEPSEQPGDEQTETEAPGQAGGDTGGEAGSSTGGSSSSSTGQGALPRTGVNIGLSLAAGFGLIAIGAGLVFGRRRG